MFFLFITQGVKGFFHPLSLFLHVIIQLLCLKIHQINVMNRKCKWS